MAQSAKMSTDQSGDSEGNLREVAMFVRII